MKNSIRVAVTPRSFVNNPMLRKELLERYDNVTFSSSNEPLSGRKLIDFLRGHGKAITGLEVLDTSIFSVLPELKVVSNPTTTYST